MSRFRLLIFPIVVVLYGFVIQTLYPWSDRTGMSLCARTLFFSPLLYLPRAVLIQMCSYITRSNRNAIDTAWWEEEANTCLISKHGQGGVSSSSRAPGGDSLKQEEQSTPPVSPSPSTMRRGSGSWVEFVGSPMKGNVCQTEEVGVLVKGRLFEVDLKSRRMKPCYWPGSFHRTIRGTWFVDKQGDFVPVREMIAEKLEQAFLSRAWDPAKGLLKPQRDGRLAARIELTSHQGAVVMYALFYSGYECYIIWDTSFAWIKKKLSKSGGETRLALKRGYTEPPTEAALHKEANVAEEKIDNEVAKYPTPKSLVFAIHGIGQNISGANIVQDARELKSTILKAEAAMKDGDESPQERIEVLPVQWRKTLNLEIDSLAASLMPPGISSLRHVLHSTAVEVLFYLTPMHRAAILDSVVNSLNFVYRKFMNRNPGFCGKVSIFAHSLGSILSWDVLCNQGDFAQVAQDPIAPSWAPNTLDIGQLEFDVDTLFIAGSPLGCFLALRGVNQAAGTGLGTRASAALMQCNPNRPGPRDGLPKVNRLYNIYHPYDPVAYRLEPLAYAKVELEGRKNALVELVGGGRRIHIAAQELGDNMSQAASRFGSSIAGAFTFSKKGKIETQEEEKGDTLLSEAETMQSPPEEMQKDSSNVVETYIDKSSTNISRIAGGHMDPELGRPTSSRGRIDFALQEASLEHQYVAALGAHFSYWNSQDVGLFVLRALNGVDPISNQKN